VTADQSPSGHAPPGEPDSSARDRVQLGQFAADGFFQRLFEDAPDAIVIVDGDGRIILANHRTLEMFGYAPEDVIGQPIEMFLPASYRQVHVEHRRRYAADPHSRPLGIGLALTGRRKDGVEFPVEISLSPTETEGSLFTTSVIRDISERRRTEREREDLLQREQAARAEAERSAAERTAILRNIGDGVVIADASGAITFLNEAAQALCGPIALGTSVEEYAAHCHVLGPGGQAIDVDTFPLVRACRSGETIVWIDLYVRRPNGTRAIVESSVTPMLADDGGQFGAVMTLHDVTAQRSLERQKDEFLANVSHDLRTPLTAIKASIGVVLANEPPATPPPVHRMLVNIELATDRMARLVADLLELTRLQAGRVQLRSIQCDLRDLATRSARAIEPLALAKGQRIRYELPREACLALVDPDRIERTLLNLIANAQRFGAAGGTIEVRVENRHQEIVVSVTDDGPGIPEDEHLRIFDRYYRSETEAAQRNQGSGLGLPIARAMVELHGGRIWVESTPGAGATFRIAVPAEAQPDESARWSATQ
jgi:PAS domain S-box-containing protein